MERNADNFLPSSRIEFAEKERNVDSFCAKLELCNN